MVTVRSPLALEVDRISPPTSEAMSASRTPPLAVAATAVVRVSAVARVVVLVSEMAARSSTVCPLRTATVASTRAESPGNVTLPMSTRACVRRTAPVESRSEALESRVDCGPARMSPLTSTRLPMGSARAAATVVGGKASSATMVLGLPWGKTCTAFGVRIVTSESPRTDPSISMAYGP